MADRFPVIFLDFDGVLNSNIWLGVNHGVKSLDPRAVSVLNELVAKSGARVVVSSTWRLMGFEAVCAALKSAGFVGGVIGMTPVRCVARGREIQEWLCEHFAEVSSFVILDDDSDMAHLLPRLVQTSFVDGLLPKHIPLCLEKLAVPYSGGRIWTGAEREVGNG